MSSQNEGFQSLQQTRRMAALFILDKSQATTNGLELPAPIPRYLGTEEGDGDILWGYFGDSLGDVAGSFERSDTDGIFQYRAYDLDTGQKYVPVFQVIR